MSNGSKPGSNDPPGPASPAGRAVPPEDITPLEFFTRWVPEMVERDERRRKKLGETEARIVFAFDEVELGAYTITVSGGRVFGASGRVEAPDLAIQVGVETWRSLNRGDISAPEAALRRRLRMSGNALLALKLHLILG